VYARGLQSLIIRDWRFLAPATNNQLDFMLRLPESCVSLNTPRLAGGRSSWKATVTPFWIRGNFASGAFLSCRVV